MSYFLRFFLSLLLIPVFLVLLVIAIPVLMLITCVTAQSPRRVRVKTFTAIWPPGQTADKPNPSSANESVYDVDCTVISSTPMEENRESVKNGKLSSIQAPEALPSMRKNRDMPEDD